MIDESFPIRLRSHSLQQHTQTSSMHNILLHMTHHAPSLTAASALSTQTSLAMARSHVVPPSRRACITRGPSDWLPHVIASLEHAHSIVRASNVSVVFPIAAGWVPHAIFCKNRGICPYTMTSCSSDHLLLHRTPLRCLLTYSKVSGTGMTQGDIEMGTDTDTDMNTDRHRLT